MNLSGFKTPTVPSSPNKKRKAQQGTLSGFLSPNKAAKKTPEKTEEGNDD